MLLRIASDLHTEWYTHNKFSKLLRHYLPPDDRDKDSILILAGDCWTFHHWKTTGLPMFTDLAKRFRYVLNVYGNHTFYGGEWWNDYKTFWNERLIPKNVKILDDDYFIIDDVVFTGSTLWTSMNNRDPITMWHCEHQMNDYVNIKYNGIPDGPYQNTARRISAESTVTRHEESIAIIRSSLRIQRQFFQKHVVITHHIPSFAMINDNYKGDMLNHAFATELSDIIIDYEPTLWVCGHSHHAVDMKIGNTRCFINAAGYHAHENQKQLGYNDRLFVEV